MTGDFISYVSIRALALGGALLVAIPVRRWLLAERSRRAAEGRESDVADIVDWLLVSSAFVGGFFMAADIASRLH